MLYLSASNLYTYNDVGACLQVGKLLCTGQVRPLHVQRRHHSGAAQHVHLWAGRTSATQCYDDGLQGKQGLTDERVTRINRAYAQQYSSAATSMKTGIRADVESNQRALRI